MVRYKGFRNNIFDTVNTSFLVLLSAAFLYPIIMTFSLSVSSSVELGNRAMRLLPVGFTLESYRTLLSDPRMFRYYGNTILYAGLAVVTMLVTTSMLAYPLTFPGFRGKKVITVMLVITMFFGGGLVPTYLVVQRLGLLNTTWAIVLPGTIAAWNVILFRTFFTQLPTSYRESALMDGAGEFRVLFQIVWPLSKALLATFSLFTVVGHWNEYLSALMYLRDPDRYPIQMFLRKVLVLLDTTDIEELAIFNNFEEVSSRTAKSAAVILTIIPIFSFYPVIQKHFTKGIFVGSIKG